MNPAAPGDYAPSIVLVVGGLTLGLLVLLWLGHSAVRWLETPLSPAAAPQRSTSASDASAPMNREQQIETLERAFWTARRAGDIARADQIGAELRELRAPHWC